MSSNNKLRCYVDDKEIKEIERYVKADNVESLPRWYLSILDKTISDLSVFELNRCLNQNMFVDLALEEIVNRLLEDINEFAFYSDSILPKVFSLDMKLLHKYTKQFKDIHDKFELIVEESKFEYYSKDEAVEALIIMTDIVDKLNSEIPHI